MKPGDKVKIINQPPPPFLFVVPVGAICIVEKIGDGFAKIYKVDSTNYPAGGCGRLPIDCLELLDG